MIKNISVPDRLRQAGIKLNMGKRTLYNIPEAEKTEADHIVHE